MKHVVLSLSGDEPSPQLADGTAECLQHCWIPRFLWPSLQRDFLLSLAIEGLYRPLWSTAIFDELEFHEPRSLSAVASTPTPAVRARRLVDQMSSAFDDALVENWEPLEGTFGLPGPDDEHVVAAAMVGGAEVIVTSNLKDFPPQRIPESLKVVSPAQFAADTVSVSPDVARRAVAAMAVRFFQPPLTIDQVLDLIVDRYRWSKPLNSSAPRLERGSRPLGGCDR